MQTATVSDLDGAAGSVGQVRESTVRLMAFAKAEGVAVVLVGHVTKDGSIAGPKTLEHLVDAVIALEGERYATLRIARATKNRFGSTDEVGVFEMASEGLREVADPARRSWSSTRMLPQGASSRPRWRAAGHSSSRSRPSSRRPGTARPRARPSASTRPGSVCSSRSLAVAPASRSARTTSTPTLPAVFDVAEPGLDLPIGLALASSLRDRPIDRSTVAIGEVGLLGELRAVRGLDRRLREAARLGYRRAIVPADDREPMSAVAGLEVIRVATLRDAVAATVGGRSGRVDGDALPAMLG